MLVLIVGVFFLPALVVGFWLADLTLDAYLARRRTRRLSTTGVVRPRCVVLPSPGRRAATFPRRGAVHSHGRRP